jgi:phage tail-like protein
MAEAAQQAPQTAPSGAQPGVFVDPYRAYNFKLVIQGVVEGHFTECSGMGIKVQALEYREGGQQQVVHRIPGRVEYSSVSLRYGLTPSRELWDWFIAGVKGSVQRKNVSILMLDSEGITEVMRWDMINAWATEWRGAPLDALHGEMAVETLVLVFESLERA